MDRGQEQFQRRNYVEQFQRKKLKDNPGQEQFQKRNCVAIHRDCF